VIVGTIKIGFDLCRANWNRQPWAGVVFGAPKPFSGNSRELSCVNRVTAAAATQTPTMTRFAAEEPGTPKLFACISTRKLSHFGKYWLFFLPFTDTAVAFVEDLEKRKIFRDKVVTEISPLLNYFPAEKYHQEYFENNPMQPYCAYVVAPKVEKAEDLFGDLFKR